MKKFYYVLVLAMAVSACENNNNVNPNNNTNNPEINCADGMDNDLDGLIDCNDSDCAENSACVTAPNCGNGLIDPDEECDGPDLNGASCESLQLGAGTLTCQDCAYNVSSCHPDPLKIYQSGSRMKMRVGTGINGDESRDFRGWYDSALNINCVFRKTEDGLIKCIPELTSLKDQRYADANCTDRLAVFYADDPDLQVETKVSMEVRSGVYRVVQVMEKVEIGIFDNSGSSCSQKANPGDKSVYRVSGVDISIYQGQQETVE